MKKINVTVNNRVASCMANSQIICGNSDYEIAFEFDSEWDAYPKKTARFIWNGRYYDVDFTGNICPVPSIRNARELDVGVYVGELRTTTSARVMCIRSVRSGNEPQHSGSAEKYTNEAKKAAEEAKAEAERAKAEADRAENAAKEVEGVEEALDRIIEIQNSLIGGDSV